MSVAQVVILVTLYIIFLRFVSIRVKIDLHESFVVPRVSNFSFVITVLIVLDGLEVFLDLSVSNSRKEVEVSRFVVSVVVESEIVW